MHRIPLFIIFFISGLLSACSGSPQGGPFLHNASLTTCGPGAAEIQVGDGFMRVLCGCVGAGELQGQVFSTPGELRCTLPSRNTKVFFYFGGTVLKHQIVSVGTPTFPSSPIRDMITDDPQNPIHGVEFPSQATYTFQDTFNGLTGQIIVP